MPHKPSVRINLMVMWFHVMSAGFDAREASSLCSLEAFNSRLNSFNGNRIVRLYLECSILCLKHGRSLENVSYYYIIPFLIWRLTWQPKWKRWDRVSLKESTWIIHHLLLYFHHLLLCLPWCPLSTLFHFIPEPWAQFHPRLKHEAGGLQVST